MATSQPDWAGSAPPSLPHPPRRIPRVQVGGGWVFTDGGIAADITAVDVERLRIPPIAPPTMRRT